MQQLIRNKNQIIFIMIILRRTIFEFKLFHIGIRCIIGEWICEYELYLWVFISIHEFMSMCWNVIKSSLMLLKCIHSVTLTLIGISSVYNLSGEWFSIPSTHLFSLHASSPSTPSFFVRPNLPRSLFVLRLLCFNLPFIRF